MFLRIVLAGGGLLIALFIVLVMPEFIDVLNDFPAQLGIPVAIAMYLAALPFYYVLYETFRLIHYIDTNKAFSKRSVKSLKRIKYGAIALGGVYAFTTPFLWVMARMADAPGVFGFGLVITGAAIAVATFAAVMQLVLQSAVEMKKEHDLTV